MEREFVFMFLLLAFRVFFHPFQLRILYDSSLLPPASTWASLYADGQTGIYL